MVSPTATRIKSLQTLLASRERPLCRLEQLCVERLIRDFDTAPDRGFLWDEQAAEKAILFFEKGLKHYKGPMAGKPFILRPDQRECIIAPLFGWKRRVDGTRRFRRAYVEVPRKNGKTTLAAGIGLIGLTQDREAGAEVYSAATNRDQASIVFKAAQAMARQSAVLRRKLTVHKYAIECLPLNGVFQALAAESDSLQGKNTHVGIVDELHAHRDGEVYEVLTTSTQARSQPLVAALTTAGNTTQSFCFTEREYVRRILEGQIEADHVLGYIATIDEDDDWRDRRSWIKANPGLGIGGIDITAIEAEADKALATPSVLNTFLRYYLNVWVQQSDRWLDMTAWQECGEAQRFSDDDLLGMPCYGGIDLALSADLTAWALLFPLPDGGFAVRVRFWVPSEGIVEREHRDRVPYSQWIRDGLIETTAGNVLDYEAVRGAVIEDSEKFDVRQIGYDPWNATTTAAKMESYDGLPMMPVRQGYVTLNAPSKELERLVMQRKLYHSGNPVLMWHADSVSVLEDNNSMIRPVKPKRDSGKKIDGIAATVIALSLAMGGEIEEQESVYNQRGMVTL